MYGASVVPESGRTYAQVCVRCVRAGLPKGVLRGDLPLGEVRHLLRMRPQCVRSLGRWSGKCGKEQQWRTGHKTVQIPVRHEIEVLLVLLILASFYFQSRCSKKVHRYFCTFSWQIESSMNQAKPYPPPASHLSRLNQ